MCGLTQEYGGSIVLTAHPAKNATGPATVRGAGELSADLDVLWSLSYGDDNDGRRSMRCWKDRDGDLEHSAVEFSIEEKDGSYMRLVPVALDRSDDLTPSDQTVLDVLAGLGTPTHAQLLAAVVDETDVSRASYLKNLTSLGQILPVGDLIFEAEKV